MHRLADHWLDVAVNFSDIFPLKYSVAAVGLPVTVVRASSKLSALIASRKTVWRPERPAAPPGSC
jgi:hypothetical protein